MLKLYFSYDYKMKTLWKIRFNFDNAISKVINFINVLNTNKF